MSATTASFTSAADGTEILNYAWTDVAGPPAGVVQIAHGLAEHGERYARFAKALNAAGFIVHAVDHRGHGRTAQGRLGDFGPAGFDGLIADVAQFGAVLRARYGGLPLFLFGHSMGSFAAQAAIIDHAPTWSGVVLSGSTALDVLAEGMANAPVDAPSGLAAFNAGFEHRTGYEWLSRDAAEVDAYVADPWCGWDIPDGLIPSLFAPAARLANPAVLATIRHDLPILITSGDADPLAGGGALLQLLGQRYREAGIADVTVMLYPAGRHEMLNETNRDQVTADIVDWLRAHAAQAARKDRSVITIHHLGVSQSERIVWLMEELDLPYRLKWYDRRPNKAGPDEYLALHPTAMAPVIEDGDLVFTESAVIAEYICHRHAGGRMTGGSAQPNYDDHLYWMRVES